MRRGVHVLFRWKGFGMVFFPSAFAASKKDAEFREFVAHLDKGDLVPAKGGAEGGAARFG